MNCTLKKICGGPIGVFTAMALFMVIGQASAQIPEGVIATQSAPLYLAGTPLDVSCTFTVPAGRSLQSLLWSPALPTGWALVSVTGDGDPLIDTEGGITFFGDLSSSPVRFSYRVTVPEGTMGPKTLGGTAAFLLDGMFNPESYALSPFTLSEVTASHAALGYLAGQRLDITCTFSYRAERQLQSLLWVPELPSGWTLVHASGQGDPQVDPAHGSITLFGDLSSNPVTFSYTVDVPADAVGTNRVGGRAEYLLDNMINPVSTRALPDLLAVPPMQTLQIVSAYGAGVPAVGLYTNFCGTTVTNRINDRVSIGTRTFACSGWTLAGNEPVTGSGTNCVLTLTNNAVLTWTWVAPLISPTGTVNVTMGEDNDPAHVWVQPALSAVTTSDPAGQPAGTLTWSLKTQAAHGTAEVTGAGATPTIAYASTTNYYGGDSFVVQVADGLGGLDQVTVGVTVSPVNDAPVLMPVGNWRTDERTPLTFTVSATDVDLPAQALIFSLDAASQAVGMTINPTNGVFMWTPTAGQAGLDLTVYPVTVTVTDNGTGPANQSDSEEFTITLDSSHATHTAVGYLANSTLEITCSFAYPAGRQLQSLLWKPGLPANWTLLSATGDGGPEVYQTDGSVVFSGGDLPTHNPVTFLYRVSVPPGVTGPQLVVGVVEYQMDGMFNPARVRAQPDPLVVPMLLTLPNLVASDKVYDGFTNATVITYGALAGVAPGDVVTLVSTGATASFDTPLAGTNKSVTVSGLALAGANASWYAIAAQNTTAAIARRTLTVGGSFMADNKTYDGTVSATITENTLTLANKVGADGVALNAVVAFADPGVGSGKTVNLTDGSSLSGAAAGNYTLSLEGAPTTTADILFPAISGTQACDGFRSPSAGTVISNSFVYPADKTLTALTWRPMLPTGWALTGVSGDGAPSVNGGTEIVFAGPFTQRPVAFAYTVTVPGNQAVTNTLKANVVLGWVGMTGTLVAENLPTTLLLKRYHSADYQAPFWSIDGYEASRFLGYWRAGAYHGDAAQADGYEAYSGNTADGYHSADYQAPFWSIDGYEASRVLGYWRAGSYHVDPAQMDGYDAGP